MNSELYAKIKDYKKKLESELNVLKNNRIALNAKTSVGEELSAKERRQDAELVAQIKDVETKLEKIEDFKTYQKLRKSFNALTTNISDEERAKHNKFILNYFKMVNKELREDLEKDVPELEGKNLKEISKMETALEQDMDILDTTIEIVSKNNGDTHNIEQDKIDSNAKLTAIKRFKTLYVPEDILVEDLKALASRYSKKDKLAIVNNYITKFADYEKSVTEEIIIDMNNTNIETLTTTPSKDQTIEELIDITNKNRNSNHTAGKIVLGVVGIGILTGLIIYGVKSCEKENTKDTNNDIDEIKNEQKNTTVGTQNPFVSKLVAKGYDEITATAISNNFTPETLNKVLNMDYNEIFVNYAFAKGFDLNYLNDYNEYKVIYNLPTKKVVDYVNRSHKIQETKFYGNADISDIMPVIKAIDDKELFLRENASEAQSINTGINQIVMNYLSGTPTEKDVNKLEAIKYFANEESDLGKFLKEFSTIAKSILSNPDDESKKELMKNYITIFATSVNGYTNDKSVLTNDERFNNNAKVNDYFDWYMAYESFVGPLGEVLMYPRELQGVDFFYIEEIYNATWNIEDTAKKASTREYLINKYGFGNYKETLFKIFEIYDLRGLMQTALNDPEIQNICGYGKTLGGE